MTQEHEIEIGRIVIDSEGISPADAQGLAEAFERTLAEALGRPWQGPASIPAVRPVQVEWSPGAAAAEIGQRAALDVASAIRQGV